MSVSLNSGFQIRSSVKRQVIQSRLKTACPAVKTSTYNEKLLSVHYVQGLSCHSPISDQKTYNHQ